MLFKRLFTGLLLFICFFHLNGQSLDLRILEHINGPVSPADKTWRYVSTSDAAVLTIIPLSMLATGLITHNDKLTLKSIETGGSIIVAEGATFILKDITKRERPYLAHPDLIVGKASDTDYSFPSGHTATVFAMATSLSLSFPKWYVIAPSFAYAATVGYSRMYLGVHYPSDVLAGALIGAGSSLLTFKLQKLLNKRHKAH